MAKHEVVIHENTGATKVEAPYLGSYIAKETVKEGVFVNSIAMLCGMSAVQVTAILDGTFEAIEELEREGLVRVHTDIGVICGVITGSFPTSDAAFDKDRNALELALRIDEAIRLALTDVVPTIIADENLTKLRVDNVMDLEVNRPMNLIHGQHRFRVAGFNMELTDEGATAYLLNGMGTTFPLTIDEVKSKQLFIAHTSDLLEAGDYKLVVKSRAGDAEGPLQTAFRRVKYLRVVDPPVPIAESADGLIKVWKIEPVEGEKITLGKNTKVTGEMLGYNSETGEGIMGVHLIFPGGISYECGMDTIPPESTELILKPGEIPEGLEPGDYEVEMQLERVRDFAFAEMITVHNLPVTVEAQ